MQLLPTLAACFLTLACGGAALPVTEVHSTLPDFQIQVRDSIFVHVRDPKTSAETSYIHLTDLPNACERLHRNEIQLDLTRTHQNVPGSHWLTWSVVTLDRVRTPIKLGMVAMHPPPQDQEAGNPAWFFNKMFGYSAVGTGVTRCASQLLPHEDVGLELYEYQPFDGGIAEGRFELRRGNDRIWGSFYAKYCPMNALPLIDPACGT